MHLLISNLILLCAHYCVFNHFRYDEVRLYFFSEYLTEGITDPCGKNENYVRVNSTIKIEIRDKNEVAELENLLLQEQMIKCKIENAEFNTQMVVDFISRGQIIKTIAFSTNNRIRFDENNNEEYYLAGRAKLIFDKFHAFFRDVIVTTK